MSILLLTRTLWGEPPRLRHQVAQLLLDSGQRVLFAERPMLFGTPGFLARQHVRARSEQLLLLPQQDLVHHQLRFVPVLHQLNAAWAHTALQRVLAQRPASGPHQLEQVINFNYDAFWLRRLFPSLPITTIINDDFEALSRFPFHGHLTWALARTCAMSDRVLAVSHPLLERLSRWCDPELFLPWAGAPYAAPPAQGARNVVLFWGFINDRMDQEVILQTLPALREAGYKLRFVGPVQPSGAQLKQRLCSEPAVEWQESCSFDELDTADCCAALIPYRLDCPGVEAIQLSNKALQLLSRGLPLIISAMPHFHQAPYVLPYGSSDYPSLSAAIHSAAARFAALQPAIASFVAANGPKQRLEQLLGLAAS
jgi:hypothetical protein